MALADIDAPETSEAAAPTARRRALSVLLGDRSTLVCLAILAAFLLIALAAPLIAGDPLAIEPANRLKGPGAGAIWGTDHLGRDVYARAIFGTRNSLIVGFSVAVTTTLLGVAIGIYAGFSRLGGAAIMRLNDAMMSIPAVLLAIALASLMRAGLLTVIIAITIPEIPRMVRLVRSVVLGVREQPYITAAISIGTSGLPLVLRHVLPNTLGPVMVQATYACASAIIVSAILSFLGVGTSPEIPSWGGMMADARSYFRINPVLMLYPGVLLSLLILAVNMLGDRLSDALDTRKQMRGAL